MLEVIIGVGSNINPLFHLRQALSELRMISQLEVIQVASIYESEALLPENAPTDWNLNYLNSAILVKTEIANPHDLLKILKDIEKKNHREKNLRWSPRTLDLDILWWENKHLQTESLNIPHKEIEQRPFVYYPLIELKPSLQNVFEKKWKILKNNEFENKTWRSHNTWPQLVGILNLTLDSFSDGGQFLNLSHKEIFNEEVFLNKVVTLVSEGAEVLDLGAESTRPLASEVDAELEWNRLHKALTCLQKNNLFNKVKISIDSRKAQVQEKAFNQFEISYLNDVEGFKSKKMLELAQKNKAQLICMHSISVPPIKNQYLESDSSVEDYFKKWWSSKMELFQNYEIEFNRLIFDMGVGFGLKPQDAFYLLENLNVLKDIKNPIYIGHSRKSFLKTKYNLDVMSADEATCDITQKINQAYCQYLRVHNVKTNKEALIYGLNPSNVNEAQIYSSSKNKESL